MTKEQLLMLAMVCVLIIVATFLLNYAAKVILTSYESKVNKRLPSITDPNDVAFCRMAFNNTTFMASVTLPSGFKVANPPDGFKWVADGEKFRLEKK